MPHDDQGALAQSRSNRWLRLAQSAWWLVAAVAVACFALSMPGYALSFQGQDPFTPAADPANGVFILRGITSLLTGLLCLALATLLYRRKRDEPMALFVSFYLLTYGVIWAGPLEHMETAVPGIIDVSLSVIQPVFFSAPTVWLAILFPNGRLAPNWSRWLIPAPLLTLVLLPFADARAMATLNSLPAQLLALSWVVLFIVALAVQVHRYRRVYSETERQRTRWVVFGLALWLVLMLVQSIPYMYLQNLPEGSEAPPWAAASGLLWFVALATVPITLTISILRHRLYDIDVIIHRALVYGSLTAILAGLYAASISLFQRGFVAVTGQKSDAAIVLTSLILASAFTPIRTRLQAAVDRRFKDLHDTRRSLDDLVEEVRRGLWVVSPVQASRRLLDEALTAFDAQGGAVYLRDNGRERLVHQTGDGIGQPAIDVPLAAGRAEHGRLVLSRRKNAADYTAEDVKLLARTAEAVAAAFPEAAGDLKRG